MFVMTESSSHLFHIMWPWNLKDPTATVKKMVQKKKVTFDSVFLLKLSLWMIETITKRKRGKKREKERCHFKLSTRLWVLLDVENLFGYSYGTQKIPSCTPIINS